ncbi:hypothetical protein GCM10010230_50730 [Streptomyces narbonensis]|uniref:hypothetical protein n=1 Tax=Streptomyces narbonensis TaxID=67333 RepID=UPI001673BD34|nr:hypothetical protein [Streptomyces narbonensis]GGW07109.1 hypothetical protein GCM10010230_50730 [Streptomyces narbonensis]
MNAADEGRQQLDAASVLNAKRTLLQLLARAGVWSGDAEELIGLVEAGALALAHTEIGASGRSAPEGNGEHYEAGWRDGTRAVSDELADIAERTLRRALAPDPTASSPDDRSPVGRAEMERAKVAITPLYLSYTAVSELDPDATEQVLTAVLSTMSPRQRAGYPGRLTEFATAHHARLERLYAEYGPGSAIAIHGRYSLVHSPTSVAVLERLAAAPAALHEEWDAAELPPAWLDGLLTAWGPAAA